MFRFIGKFEFKPFSPDSRQARRILQVIANPEKRKTFLTQLQKRKPANYEINEKLLNKELVASMSKPDSLRVGSYERPVIEHSLTNYPSAEYLDGYPVSGTSDNDVSNILEYYKTHTHASPETVLNMRIKGGTTKPAITSRTLSGFKPVTTRKRKTVNNGSDVFGYLLRNGVSPEMAKQMTDLINEESALRGKSPLDVLSSLSSIQQPLLEKVYKTDKDEAKRQNQYIRDVYGIDQIEPIINQYNGKFLDDVLYHRFFRTPDDLTKTKVEINS